MTRVREFTARTFSSWRIRNLRLFFTGQIVSQLGVWTSRTAQTLLVLELTGSGLQLGLLSACQYGPVLVLGAWAGAVADRSDKRKLLMLVQALSIVPSLGLGLLVAFGTVSVEAVFVLALLQGIMTAFDNPTRRAYVVDLIEPDQVSNAVSMTSMVITTAQMVGPALAGVLILSIGYAACFFLDSLSYVAAFVALGMIRATRPSTKAPTTGGQIRAGLKYIVSEKNLYVPLGMMALVGSLAFNFSVSAPLFVTSALQGGPSAITIALSLISLGSVIGALATARRTNVPHIHLALASAMFGVSLLVFASTPVAALAFVTAPLVGIAGAFFFTTLATLVQLEARPEFRGRVLALQSIVFLGSMPIGGPIIGWTADNLGGRAGILLGGLSCLAAALWGWSVWGTKRPRVVEPRGG